MPIQFQCENCGRRYQVEERFAGKRVVCKSCEHLILIPNLDEEVPSFQSVAADERSEAEMRIGFEDGTSPEKRPAGIGGDAPAEAAAGPDPDRRSPVSDWEQRVRTEIEKVYVGQHELVRGALIALLARGHVLIESVPGLGKTLLVRVLGKVLGCKFQRIQFTPDLMPSDITGTSIYDERLGEFRFRAGPVFTQLLLADEINRSPAKTHSALLEIMQEASVTVDGQTHELEPPFLVLATQNPIESEGTYNLPEAQLDRFLFKLLADYPSRGEETEILRLHTEGQDPESILESRVATATGPAEILEMQQHGDQVLADQRLLDYIATIIRRTRDWPAFSLGASPRAGVALLRGARAAAAIEGRDFIVPDDVQEVAALALRHRILLTPEAEIEGRRVDELIAEVVRSVEVPRR